MRPILQDNDVAQFWKILERLERLERSSIKRYSFTAVGTGAISVSTSTPTKYGYSNETSDPDGAYDVANTRYVAPVDGWYEFTAGLRLPSPGAANTRWQFLLYVNGASVRMLEVNWATSAWSNDKTLRGSSGRILLSEGDLVDCRVIHNNASSLNVGDSTASSTFFTGGPA